MATKSIAEMREAALLKASKAKKGMAINEAAKHSANYVDLPDPTGDAEVDSLADLDAVQEGFRKRASNEAKRFELSTDSEYWACLCFQSREQCNAFLKALDLLHIGDKYLDGVKVAEKLGVVLPPADVPYNTSERIDKTWLEMSGFKD